MHDEVATELGTFREVARRPMSLEDRWIFRCPGCGVWAYMDDDQWHGRVSVDHTVGRPEGSDPCTYHETHDFAAGLASALEIAVESI
jgi:hypothetical protein